MRNKKLNVKGSEIFIFERQNQDYISLTDIARYKNADEPKDVVKNWMRSKNVIEFLGIWEKLNNPDFKGVEFDLFERQAGSNAFVLTPQKWILKTNSIGIVSRAGNSGGTFAHKDIAFEFASWISPEFKLFLIKEFQRLKEQEIKKESLGWDLKRSLAKIYYKVHTDAVKEYLIPRKLGEVDIRAVYASEGDLLNKALFNITAKEWRDENPLLEGNVRDYATVEQLVVLSSLETMNAEFIRQGLDSRHRLVRLNEIAIIQMKSILGHASLKKLK
jgi:hypothetical protein